MAKVMSIEGKVVTLEGGSTTTLTGRCKITKNGKPSGRGEILPGDEFTVAEYRDGQVTSVVVSSPKQPEPPKKVKPPRELPK